MISPRAMILFLLSFIISSHYNGFVTQVSSLPLNPRTSKVTLYRCDEKNQKIPTSIEGHSAESLLDAGLRIRLCIKVTPEAKLNNLYILKVKDFEFTRPRTPAMVEAAVEAAIDGHISSKSTIPSIIRQKAVENGLPVSDDITMVLCTPGSILCVVETTLTGYYFLTDGTLHGKGSVLMQSGSANERRFLGSRLQRQLQHIDTFEYVNIYLDFVGEREKMPLIDFIVGEDRENVSLYYNSIGVIAIIMMCFCCCCTIFCCCHKFCTNKKDNRLQFIKDIDDDDDDIDIDNVQTTVPIIIAWGTSKQTHNRMKCYNPNKKGNIDIRTDDDDLSETHSLDEDDFWVEDESLEEGIESSNGSKAAADYNQNQDDYEGEYNLSSSRTTKTKTTKKPKIVKKISSPRKKNKSRSISATTEKKNVKKIAQKKNKSRSIPTTTGMKNIKKIATAA